MARGTPEIGVRIALRAQPGQIARAMIREALAVAGAGPAIGIPTSMALSSLVPARRAAAIDPIRALRCE